MYAALHQVVIFLFAVVPAAAWGWAIRRSVKRNHFEPLVSFLITCFSAVILGTAIVILYTVLLHGRVLIGQVIQCWYFLIGLLCLIGFLRWALREGSWRLLRVARNEQGRPIHPNGWRASLAYLLQGAGLLVVGMPLIVGMMLVHRVRVHSSQTPLTRAGCDFEDVRFAATDGVGIAGWWVPADPAPAANDQAGDRTVLMCFDMGDDLAREASLMRVLVSGGYNVLAFDLRGNGDSDGQWASFGDVERRDILGAVRWLKANHPDEARKIYGLGGGTAGAALIAAAADPGDDGQAIEAIAVYDTFADFSEYARSILNDRISRPFRSGILRLILPVASAGAGGNLSTFSPARLAPQLWPRPLLVIHGRADSVVPVEQGMDLFHAASFPKESCWLPDDHVSVYLNRRGAGTLLQFFDNARSIPAI